MKEETKKKLFKISKIVGFAITFGFAVFGALCAAMLIGNGSKKDDIKTLDSSLVLNEVRSERNSKPRKAPDYEGAENLFNTDNAIRDVYFWGTYAETLSNFDTYLLELEPGYYFVKAYGPYANANPFVNSFGNTLAEVKAFGEYVGQFGWGTKKNYSDYSPTLFVQSKGNLSEGYIFVNSSFPVVSFSLHYQNSLFVSLVDTLEVPPENVVNFPSNWSPMALISDNLSVKGGYAFVDVSPATYQTMVPIQISFKQNLFRYDGKVYDEMVFTFVDLSHGDGYIQDDGQPWKPWEKTTAQLSSSHHVFGLYSLRFNASFSGDSIVALSPIYSDSPFQTGGDGTYYPPTVYLPTGEYRWVNPKVTYIEFIDTSFGSGSTRYDGRYSDYTDLDLLIYLNGYLSEGNYLAIGASGGVFDLMSGAFNGLLPILNVQILPNITLGILLFLPLVGGIIVIIIRVVKK